MPINVVIYARYSSDNQREESIEGQIRVCTEYAERHDMCVIEVYADRAMTGRNTNRPEFQRMMADSKKGIFKHVLVWKGDRISLIAMIKQTAESSSRRQGLPSLA